MPKPKTLTMDWNLDDEDETDAVVHFTYEPGTSASGHSGPPEHYDPGSAGEIVIEKVVAAGGEVVTMSDAEAAKFRTWVEENPERFLDRPDPDYERDSDEDRRSFGR